MHFTNKLCKKMMMFVKNYLKIWKYLYESKLLTNCRFENKIKLKIYLVRYDIKLILKCINILNLIFIDKAFALSSVNKF